MEMNENLPFLTTKELHPENQESPIHFIENWITPLPYVYRRNHFKYPKLTKDMFKLQVSGEVINPMDFKYEDLIKMPTKELVVPLECSGNKRNYFEPKVYGEQWEDGAISQGYYKGVSLRKLLTKTGIKGSAKEVVFEGHDFGRRKDIDGIFHFSRSLPIEKALDPNTIIAFELNGKKLPFKHGYPLRLIVPEWYAMASVKWLKSIRVIDHHFTGPFQDIDYNYYPNKENDLGKFPVTTMNVDSIIQKPLNYSVLDQGTHVINGIAWSGTGAIESVELSFDEGRTWLKANIKQDYTNHPYRWTSWEYTWDVYESGEYTILSRAKDKFGHVQKMDAFWNRKGYGYNAIYKVKVKIE